MSIYAQLGGEAAVAVVVDDFCRRCLADPVLGQWFGSADMDSRIVHLNAYPAVALGGPEKYSGRSMRNAHSGLGVTQQAWDALLARFSDSLAAADVSAPLTGRIASKLTMLRAVIVEEAGSRPGELSPQDR
jgi:hemoglobin